MAEESPITPSDDEPKGGLSPTLLGPIIIGGGADEGNPVASADDVEVGGDFQTEDSNDLLGPINTEAAAFEPIPLPAEAEEEPGFVGSVVEGFGITESGPSWWDQYKDESVVHRVGETMMKQTIGVLDPALTETNRRSEVYRKWQPQIWNAEDELMKDGDKTSPKYQELSSQLEDLRENLRDDLEGNFKPDPTDPISISKIIDAAVENPGYMIGALAKGIAQDPGLMATPTGWVKAGDAAVKLSKLAGAGKKLQTTSKLAGQVLGGGSITGAFGGVENVLDQLKRDPNAPINIENVMKSAAAYSLIGAPLPVIGAGLKGTGVAISKAVSGTYTKAKLNQIQIEAIKIYNEAEGGISKQDAVDLAVAKHHPFDSEDLLTDLDAEKVVDDTAARIAYGENITPETFTEKLKRVSLETTDDVIRGLNNFFQPVITGIRRLGFLSVATSVMRHSKTEMKKLSDRLIIKDAYSKARKTLSDTDKDLLKFNALNGTLNDVAGDFPEEVIKAYKDVRKMLDGMRAEMVENGMLKKGGQIKISADKTSGRKNEFKVEIGDNRIGTIVRIKKGEWRFFDNSTGDFTHTGTNLKDFRKAVVKAEQDKFDVTNEAKIPGIKNFWPRDIDFKAYAKARGIDVKESFGLYADYINKKYSLEGTDAFQGKDLTGDLINEYLSPEEIAFAIADKVAGKIVPKTTIATNPLKKRTIELIEPEDLKFYADDVQSLTSYILKMTPKMEARNFFGGKLLKQSPQAREKFLAAVDVPSKSPLKDSMIKEFVKDYVRDLGEQNAILAEKIPELADLLQARFAGGFKRPNRSIANAKNLAYGFLLGNQWSASVQLGDLGSSAHINGISRTISAVQKQALKKVGVDVGDFLDMDDFGLSAMAHELEHLGWSATFNDMALKYGWFKLADRVGKVAIMNASVGKNMKATKPLRELLELDRSESIFEPNYVEKVKVAEAKAIKHFRKQYGDKVDDDTIKAMMEAFARGEIRDPDAMLATFADITKVQPISMDEMPKLYLNHPNGRVVYMLKTFTMKQIDLVRTSIFQRMTKEVKEAKTRKGKIDAIARAHGRLAHLLGTIGGANAGIDTIRQFLTGDPDFNFTEAMFSGFVRTWGWNPQAAAWIGRGRIDLAAGSLLFPPIYVLAEPFVLTAQGDVGGALLTLPVLRAGKQFIDTDDDEPFTPLQSFPDIQNFANEYGFEDYTEQ